MKTTFTFSHVLKTVSFLLLFAGVGQTEAQSQDIVLNAYIDANNNCVRDPGEQAVPSQYVTFTYMSNGSLQPIGFTTKTDCNGTAILHPVDPNLNNVQNTIAFWPYTQPGSVNQMNHFLSPCFSGFQNNAYGSVLEIPFTGTPDTASVAAATLGLLVGNGFLTFPTGNTLSYCDTNSRVVFNIRSNQYRSCIAGGNGNFSISVDGLVQDQINLTNVVGTTTVTSGAGRFTAFYNIGSDISKAWNEADMSYTLLLKSLSVGTHTLQIHCDPYPGIVEGKDYEYYLIRDACTQIRILSYVDCTMNCQKDPGEKSGLYGLGLMATSNSGFYPAYEEVDPVSLQPLHAVSCFVPSGVMTPVTINVYALNGATLCATPNGTINPNPGTVYQYTVGLQVGMNDVWNMSGNLSLPNSTTGPAANNTFSFSVLPWIDSLNHCGPAGLVDVKLRLPTDFHYASVLPGMPAPSQVNVISSGEELIWNGLDFLILDSISMTINVGAQPYSNNSACILLQMAHDGIPYYYVDQRCYSGGPVGIQEVVKLNVHIYPNPVSDKLHLKADKALKTLRVSNLLGEVLSETALDAVEYDLPVEQLLPGVYILYATDASGSTGTYKFIKQ